MNWLQFHNRVKFFFSGPFLEFLNPRLKGDPYGLLLQRLGTSEESVVDLCGGTGYLARLLLYSEVAARAFVLDLSPELLSHGRRRASGHEGLVFLRADAQRLPFRLGSLTTVVSTFAFHELPDAVRSQSFSDLARVLRPGGRLLVVDVDEPKRYRRAFRVYLYVSHGRGARGVLGSGLRDAVERAGLVVTVHQTGLGRFLPFQVLEAVKRQ